MRASGSSAFLLGNDSALSPRGANRALLSSKQEEVSLRPSQGAGSSDFNVHKKDPRGQKVREGWVQKWHSKKPKVYNQRYLILWENKELVYYNTKPYNVRSPHKGIWRLTPAGSVFLLRDDENDMSCCFQFSQDGVSCRFACASEEERESWLSPMLHMGMRLVLGPGLGESANVKNLLQTLPEIHRHMLLIPDLQKKRVALEQAERAALDNEDFVLAQQCREQLGTLIPKLRHMEQNTSLVDLYQQGLPFSLADVVEEIAVASEFTKRKEEHERKLLEEKYAMRPNEEDGPDPETLSSQLARANASPRLAPMKEPAIENLSLSNGESDEVPTPKSIETPTRSRARAMSGGSNNNNNSAGSSNSNSGGGSNSNSCSSPSNRSNVVARAPPPPPLPISSPSSNNKHQSTFSPRSSEVKSAGASKSSTWALPGRSATRRASGGASSLSSSSMSPKLSYVSPKSPCSSSSPGPRGSRSGAVSSPQAKLVLQGSFSSLSEADREGFPEDNNDNDLDSDLSSSSRWRVAELRSVDTYDSRGSGLFTSLFFGGKKPPRPADGGGGGGGGNGWESPRSDAPRGSAMGASRESLTEGLSFSGSLTMGDGVKRQDSSEKGYRSDGEGSRKPLPPHSPQLALGKSRKDEDDTKSVYRKDKKGMSQSLKFDTRSMMQDEEVEKHSRRPRTNAFFASRDDTEKELKETRDAAAAYFDKGRRDEEAMRRCAQVRDRKKKLRLHLHCFVAKDAITALLGHGIVQTREEGVALGNRLIAAGVITHVTKPGSEFRDKESLFRFTSQQ